MFFFTLLACEKNDISETFPDSQKLVALDESSLSLPLTNQCNCSLQVVDAYSPVPLGGSGGVLGYGFVCGYFGLGQSNYVFGAYATDCIETYGVSVDPTWMIQVPSGNAPTYPTGFYPFHYDIPAFQNFLVSTGDIAWFNNDGCDVNENPNTEGYLRVRLVCCDGYELAECQQCYYSDVIEMGISTDFHQGQNAPISLSGECGCEPVPSNVRF